LGYKAVSVFRMLKQGSTDDVGNSLVLVKRLYAHSKPITALLVSRAHSVIVSASEGGDCVVWDLNGLFYIRTLGPLDHPVSVIALHEASVRQPPP
jgi:WD40 repeat protein